MDLTAPQGHSLGAGYATLAYIELIRRLTLTTPTSFTLHDAWAFGSPRVLLNAGAKRLKSLLLPPQNPVRHFYRPARNGDIVPTLPVVVGNHTYKHVDVGYKLAPGNKEGRFVTLRPSEVDKVPVNDAVPLPPNAWKYHCRGFGTYWEIVTDVFFFCVLGPPMYYEGIKKVLDSEVW